MLNSDYRIVIPNGYGAGISDSGVIVGWTYGNPATASRWIPNANGGNLDQLGTFQAFDVNNSGLIVGQREVSPGNPRGVIYVGNTMVDINSRLRVDSTGWSISSAHRVNNSGAILAVGSRNNGPQTYVMLRP